MSSSSRPKRKAVAQLGEHALSAAVGDVVARTMSAAVGRYGAHASVGDQLERLAMLLVMVHSAVDEAERVHVANLWLRRWLWRLRDAALEGDEVLRSMRQQRGAQAGAAATTQAQSQGPGGRLWNAATRVVRSAKSMLVSASGGDDGGVDRLSRAVARLEQACAGLGDFLKLLELEIMRSLTPAPPPAPPSAPETRGFHDGDPVEESVSVGSIASSQPDTSLDDDGSESDHNLTDFSRGYISYAEYIGCTVAIGLQIVTRKFQRAAGKLTTPPRAPEPDTDTGDSSPAPEPDTARLRGMVADIREAVGLGDRAEVNAERRWLAEWRRELQAVADRAERVLLASSTTVGGGGDDEVTRMVRSLETAATHLRAYVTLVRFAVVVVESS